jgi:capsular polysaccharide transport system permease protein
MTGMTGMRGGRSDGAMVRAVRAKLRVIGAVMLRDLRTRFFNHGLGYLLAVAWPMAHILILLGFYTLLGRLAPYGDSMVVFFATALVPFMAWNYMSRFIMLSLVMNRALLAFPAVRILDILLGRAALELLASCAMVGLLCLLALLWGIDFVPHDLVGAAEALAASFALGLGCGMVSAVIAMILPGWVTAYTLLIIASYICSGILFVPASLPGALVEWLCWLPTFHLIEWMRVAYYEGYPDHLLDRGYVLGWGIFTIFLGLGLERMLRGRLLGG